MAAIIAASASAGRAMGSSRSKTVASAFSAEDAEAARAEASHRFVGRQPLERDGIRGGPPAPETRTRRERPAGAERHAELSRQLRRREADPRRHERAALVARRLQLGRRHVRGPFVRDPVVETGAPRPALGATAHDGGHAAQHDRSSTRAATARSFVTTRAPVAAAR
jgi:hypothetical protein